MFEFQENVIIILPRYTVTNSDKILTVCIEFGSFMYHPRLCIVTLQKPTVTKIILKP